MVGAAAEKIDRMYVQNWHRKDYIRGGIPSQTWEW
jgi:hypothetical protein